jgi:hypothetical protein
MQHVLVGAAAAVVDGVSAILKSIPGDVVIFRSVEARRSKYYKIEGQPTVQTCSRNKDAEMQRGKRRRSGAQRSECRVKKNGR